MLGYIESRRVIDLAAEADVTRGSVNRWLQWYEAAGLRGLLTEFPPGPACRLTQDQQDELAALVDAGPQAAGYTSGVWTGPMVGDLIEQRFHAPQVGGFLGPTPPKAFGPGRYQGPGALAPLSSAEH